MARDDRTSLSGRLKESGVYPRGRAWVRGLYIHRKAGKTPQLHREHSGPRVDSGRVTSRRPYRIPGVR